VGDEGSMMQKPVRLDAGTFDFHDVQKLKNAYPSARVVDILQRQLIELNEISYPDGKKPANVPLIGDSTCGSWIYYPWNETLLHMVNSEDYFKLRTNRNQLLITSHEQQQLFRSSIGFAGLSIGAHFAISMAYSGIASTMVLAENDVLETSNLNRVRCAITDVGRKKIELVAEEIYGINPYQELILLDEGLSVTNFESFFNTSIPIQIVFEAIDDFEMKIRLRIEARRRNVPVVMITNLGDSLLIDVERYDNDEQAEIFNGLIGQTAAEILDKPITELDKIRYALQIVGIRDTPTRALATLGQIGKTLVGRPQLYGTVSMGGGLAAYLARRIILKKSLPSGRYRLSLQNAMQLEDDMDDGNRDELLAQVTQRVQAE
jgi:molybdopterin/thiamine biosynthesis adenylyltransferase